MTLFRVYINTVFLSDCNKVLTLTSMKKLYF